MESFSLKPEPGDAERMAAYRESRVWWVEFARPVERLFCDKAHLAVAHMVDAGIPWTGMESHHHPVRRPTDRDGVWLLEYGIPIDRLAVAHDNMRGWMEIVRANGLHGSYREAGTEQVYEF